MKKPRRQYRYMEERTPEHILGSGPSFAILDKMAIYEWALAYASEARINSLNKGCGSIGRDLNSGWN